jgi:hypothetical protein
VKPTQEDNSEYVGLEPLEFLWSNSKKLVDHSAQLSFSDARLFLGERFFRRIMLMTLTFLHLNPLSSLFPKGAHWDLASSGAIARCVLETYLRLVYFAVEQVPEQERGFRSILSQYHAHFQAIEINTHSHAPKEILAQHQSGCDQARKALEANSYFQNLPPQWRENLISYPSRIDLPNLSFAVSTCQMM